MTEFNNINFDIDEAVEHLEEGMEVTLEQDGYNYEISESSNWIGGDVHEGYISAVLGNVVYGSARVCLEKSIEHLEKHGEGEVVIYYG